jgi:DNA-binding NarL/FixJ family response regulator
MKNENPCTIAIVDDNALVRETMHFRLTHLGYQVPMQAEHGKEFLDKLLLAGNLPDMVLLDINMPIMDGFETAAALRNQYPEIKILFFSLETGLTCMQRVSDVGADGFVAKDAPFTEVKDALARIMHQKQVA